MRHTNTTGFSIVGVIVAIAIILTLGAGGWYVWREGRPDVTPATSEPKASPSTKAKTNDPSEGGKYLVVKEWGVRLPIPQGLRGDIYYVFDEQRDDTIVIDSRSLPPEARCASFGLARTIDKVSSPTDELGFTSTSVAKIGSYHFSRLTGIIACSDSEVVHEKAANIQHQLYKNAADIEPLPGSSI